jgi:hypothetical protein
MFWLLWFIPCALTNRIRGGWLGNSIREKMPFWATTPARLFFSAAVSMPVFYTQTLKTSLTFYILFYVGLIFGWYPWQDMERPVRDILVLTARGLLLTAPAGFICNLHIFALSGSLMGLAYYVGHKVKYKYIDSEWNSWYGVEWSEIIFGGILGLFIGINIQILDFFTDFNIGR